MKGGGQLDGEQGGGAEGGSEAHGTRGEQVGLDELRPAPKHVGVNGRNRDGTGRGWVAAGVDGVQGCGGGKDKTVLPEKEGAPHTLWGGAAGDKENGATKVGGEDGNVFEGSRGP